MPWSILEIKQRNKARGKFFFEPGLMDPVQLSDAELLHIVTRGRGVAEGSLAELANSSPEALARGMGEKSAEVLAAAFELGRRVAWKPPERGEKCLDPMKVAELAKPIAFHERECFAVVLLDVRGRLLRMVKISEGSLTQCPVAPRDVFGAALRANAHGVIFVHNHPSGDPTPSAEDYELTARLRAGAELVGIYARDHVIVSHGRYYSFVEAGQWWRGQREER